jgi:hypothetical protein
VLERRICFEEEEKRKKEIIRDGDDDPHVCQSVVDK